MKRKKEKRGNQNKQTGSGAHTAAATPLLQVGGNSAHKLHLQAGLELRAGNR